MRHGIRRLALWYSPGLAMRSVRSGDLADRTHAGTPQTLEQRRNELRHHAETARLLHEMPKPTVAMLNGVAAGAGPRPSPRL